MSADVITVDRNISGDGIVLASGPDNRSEVFAMAFDSSAEETTYGIIRAAAERHPNRDALIFLSDGTVTGGERRWNYANLLDGITQAANAFRRVGVERSGVVSLLLPTLPETQLAIWSAQTAGIANPINSYLAIDQIGHILESANTQVLVTQGPSNNDLWSKVVSLADTVPTLKTIVTIDPDPPRGVSWDRFVSDAPRTNLEFAPPIPSDIAAYFHTGGTTGLPKLAKHTHNNEAFDARAIADTLGWRDLNGLILGIPLFHTAGAVYCSLGAFTAGLKVVMLGEQGYRNPRAVQGIWDTIEEFDIDFLPTMPAVIPAMIEAPSRPEQIARLKMTAVGSTQVPGPVLQEWTELIGREPVTGWGLTEGACQSTVTRPGLSRKSGSVGTPLPGCEVRVVANRDSADPNLLPDCSPGETGLILTRGPNVFPGYVDPTHDRGVLLQNGWLNTGDLGHLDEDGELWIVGRAKDLIKRSGHGIDPANVEETLNSHEHVLVSAVVGRPDVYAGELPVAYVQLRGKSETLDPDAVVEWCKQYISDPAAAPVEIIIVDQLPITAVGKISKVELRRDAARRAIEREIATALAAPTVAFKFEIVDRISAYTGTVRISGASQRSIDMLRKRLRLLPVSNAIAIEATAVARLRAHREDDGARISVSTKYK